MTKGQWIGLRGLGIVLLAVVFLLGYFTTITPTGVHAASTNFVDVESAHWAKSNIEFAASKGIVNGYYDEYSKVYTFQPEKAVTYEEATAMLWRAMVAAHIATEDETLNEEALAKYEEILTSANIANWARSYVARFLELGIIEETQLGDFVGAEGIGNPALRETIAVWTAKAIGKNTTGLYYLPYMDAAKIHAVNRPYIDMLYRQGIMQGSLEMDGYVYFKPDAGVKRCEFAAIANRVFENISSSGDMTKEYSTFTSMAQLASLYPADQVLLVTNGSNLETVSGTKAIERARANSSLVLATMALNSNDATIPQVHLDTEPVRVSGKVTFLSGDYVGVEIDKTTVFYVKSSKTNGGNNLKTGATIEFIADGVNLIEIK